MPYEIQRYNPREPEFSPSRAPQEYRASAFLPVGMPFPVHAVTRAIPLAPFHFMRRICDVPARRRPDGGRFPLNTALARAHGLKSLLEHAELEGVEFGETDDELVEDWVEDMVDAVNPRTGRPLLRRTIVGRLDSVLSCFRETNRVALTDVHLDADAAKRLAWGVDSLYNEDGTRRSMADVDALRSNRIRPLLRGEWAKVVPFLGPRPSDWVEDGRSSRPFSACSMAISDGFRCCEVAGVHARDLMAITVVEADDNYDIPLRKAKGEHVRNALIKGTSVLQAQAYVRGERETCLKAARARGLSDWREPLELHVNSLDAGRDVGFPVLPSTLQRDFRVAQERAGMTFTVTVTDDSGPRESTLPDHCFHDLRHSFAFFELHLAIARRDPDPVETVQVKLGHARRSTTENRYLRPDRRMVASVGDALARVIRGLLDG